jgi:alpha-mannosidase
MDQNELVLAKAEPLAGTVMDGRYLNPPLPLTAGFASTGSEIVPLEEAGSLDFLPIVPGDKWGLLWERGWLKLSGTLPLDWRRNEVLALIDTESEGTVFIDGKALCGITNHNSRTLFHRKRRVPLFSSCKGGEKVELLVELSANEIFGSWGKKEFYLRQCECSLFRRAWWRLALDLFFLVDLARRLNPASSRCKKILHGLEQIYSLWKEGEELDACSEITSRLLNSPANASSLTAWSVGHGHLDIAWLWPMEESRRKAVRTFATALQMMKEYPSYIFGASQPQLYQWVKEDRPELFQRISEAVRQGRWECQGAMWVEPDMNLAGGEALLRQCLYGIRFFQEAFNIRITNLWLPDVFGYPASLPQILKKCGISYFTTMKISWNDTNSFPYHTFFWEGIDGSRVLSHFLPAGDYHLDNSPKRLINAEEAFQEGGLTDGFLNMYGIGDGGGGPSRGHIEYMLRADDCEGLPKVKPSTAAQFFHHLEEEIERSGSSQFKVWKGELYLELHRGTYTTQGRIKKLNRRCEHLLQEAEFLSVLSGKGERDYFEKLWKILLLYQFHDILPGSSIRKVNEDAEKSLGNLAAELELYCRGKLLTIAGCEEGKGSFLVMNSLSFSRTVLLKTTAGQPFICTLSPFSAKVITANHDREEFLFKKIIRKGLNFQNAFFQMTIGESGWISSIVESETGREMLSAPSGVLKLWHDHPHKWEAWDIDSHYRNSKPALAVLRGQEIVFASDLLVEVKQTFSVGVSTVERTIRLYAHSPRIDMEFMIDWQETRKMLRMETHSNLHYREACYEIQWGAVYRAVHDNTSWEQAKFEVPLHRFVAVREGDLTFAVLNDGKYGAYCKGNIIDMNLLRSPINPDETADKGEHAVTLSFLPLHSSSGEEELFKQAWDLNAPPRVIEVEAKALEGGASGEDIQGEIFGSPFLIEGSGVKIETVKEAESGGDIILRLYEFLGSAKDIKLLLASVPETIATCSLLEEPEAFLSPQKELSLSFTPYEIKTLRLQGGL